MPLPSLDLPSVHSPSANRLRPLAYAGLAAGILLLGAFALIGLAFGLGWIASKVIPLTAFQAACLAMGALVLLVGVLWQLALAAFLNQAIQNGMRAFSDAGDGGFPFELDEDSADPDEDHSTRRRRDFDA